MRSVGVLGRSTRQRDGALMTLVCIGILWTLASFARAHDGVQPGVGGHQTSAPKRYARAVVSYETPDVHLIDMTGALVPLTDVLNYQGPLLLQFIFTTCPTVCPALSGLFSATLDRLESHAGRLRLISISIDPEHDTPERLRAYAQKLKAKPQWHFFTGHREDIAAVQKAFDAYQNNKMQHEPLTYLRASPATPWVRLDGFMSAGDLLAEYWQLVSR